MAKTFEAGWFAERLGDRTMRGIARETSALIRSGALPVGSKLPPVRDLAFELGVSPATVSQAWSELRRHKIIGGRGRNGAWVMGDRFAARPERHLSGGNYGPGVLNLAIASPDVGLLPPLDAALVHGARAENLNSYERVRILPQLEAAVRPSWPYEPGAKNPSGMNGVNSASSSPSASSSIIGRSPGAASIRPGRPNPSSRSVIGCCTVSRPANQNASSTPTPSRRKAARVQVLPESRQPVTPILFPARSESRSSGLSSLTMMQRWRKPRMMKHGTPMIASVPSAMAET
jgi:hypothetical protein